MRERLEPLESLPSLVPNNSKKIKSNKKHKKKQEKNTFLFIREWEQILNESKGLRKPFLYYEDQRQKKIRQFKEKKQELERLKAEHSKKQSEINTSKRSPERAWDKKART